MAENLKLARLYVVLLAIFTAGRWIMGARHIPYERGHHIFSIVTLTFLSSIFYGAFTRRWRRFGVGKAAGLGLTLAVLSQIVILLSTILSYSLGVDTYFSFPRALAAPGLDPTDAAVPFAVAVRSRLITFVGNCAFNSILGALGWLFGGALPPE